jgi:hypothetical protein
MEFGFISDLILKNNEIEESDKVYDNFYNKSKVDKNPSKRKARTQKSETKKENKIIFKILKDTKKKTSKKVKPKNKINKDKSLSILSNRIKKRKRARTPLKKNSSLDLFNKEDDKDEESFEKSKGKKAKVSDDTNHNGETELNNSYEIYDNTNLLKTENIFEEIERDDKIEKEGISNLQRMLCNNPISEQVPPDEEEEIPNQPPTAAFTILFEN